MHPKYDDTKEKLITWTREEKSVQGALILGSQVRDANEGDEWSDLDVLLFSDTPPVWMQSDRWLTFLGETVCVIAEETQLDWLNLAWSVKRVLFADNRTVDFSILPSDRVDDVLSLNAEIHAQGYEIIYDAHPNMLRSKIEHTLASLKEAPPKIPTENELQQIVNKLLFQIIFACKKIKRNELWVGVRTINQQISDLLLQLLESHSALVAETSQRIRYDGRFLEQRIHQDILRKLSLCFAKYEPSDAIQTAGHLIEITQSLTKEICEANDYPFDKDLFIKIRKLYDEIFGTIK